jgi:hypothetical protein
MAGPLQLLTPRHTFGLLVSSFNISLPHFQISRLVLPLMKFCTHAFSLTEATFIAHYKIPVYSVLKDTL